MREYIKNYKQFINENIELIQRNSTLAEQNIDVKSDIHFLYKQHPELANIGTPKQYSQYLETIFPNSKVKDIHYHSSPNKFSEFKDPSSGGFSHIWFSEKPIEHQFGGYIYSVILDIKNPLSEWDYENYRKELNNYEVPVNPQWKDNYSSTGELPQYKYDGTIRSSRVGGGKSITVRNPKQIHILGSDQDLKEFKTFVEKY